MTRRRALELAILAAAEDTCEPRLCEAAERFDRAEEACERVRRYITIRRQHADVPPSWIDLDNLWTYVQAIPGMADETPADLAEEVTL